MKIQEIRDTIDQLIWNRSDLTGATQEEFIRMNVPERLTKYIHKVKNLDIKPRFTHEIESAQRAIASSLKVIEKWKSMQPKQKTPIADKNHVYH